MPDITMCQNKQCPNASHCIRATARPSYGQSYAYFEYKVECEHYIVDKRNLLKSGN
jgi:hypothetical protein